MSRPKLRWLVLFAVIAALAAWAWWATRPKPIMVTVAEAEVGTVEKTVANTRAGTVTACRRAKMSPSVGGLIAKLPRREGDPVKRGDLLLEIWNKDIAAQRELSRREADAIRATARSTCIKSREAKREAERLATLHDRKLVSEEAADRASTEARASAADCEAAMVNAEVRDGHQEVAAANLEKTRLIAPFDGVIAEINGELNEYVTPSPPGIATKPAIDLIDNTCFYVAAPIDEVDVAQIAVGMPARVTLDAFDKRRFAGQVRRIADYVLDEEKQARTVEVEVEFVNKTDLQELLAGYSADVEIILDIRKNTTRIPTEAVLQGDQVYVFLGDDGIVEKREIKVGTANWDHTEVLEGLGAGEWVVTSVEKEGLEDGAAVKRDAGSSE